MIINIYYLMLGVYIQTHNANVHDYSCIWTDSHRHTKELDIFHYSLFQKTDPTTFNLTIVK